MDTATAQHIAAQTREIIDGLREYAQAYYEQGWDVIVEAWTDEEIAEELHKHNLATYEAAWRHFSDIVDVISDVHNDRLPMPGWDY